MMITRREFSQAAVGALLVPALGRAATARKPNVLFVMADEWRYQSTGYAGDPNVHMPSIEAFAAQSVNFENAISGCSVCCPARASFVTGQYPLTHGVYINDVPLEPKQPTIGEVFAKAGYAPGYIGKWHLYGSPDGRYGRRESFIPADKRLGFQYWKAAECTHDYNHSLYYEGDDPSRRYWDGYDAIAQTEDACRFIRDKVKRDDPYFLVLAWGPPHAPFDSAPERYRQLYRDREIVLRANVPESQRDKAIADLRGYYAHIAALDDCFQTLMQTLEATGSSDDTIVVFTSDHGDMMDSQGLKVKLYPWEESIRVPLLVRYPVNLGRTGRKSDAPINSPDLMPTLLGLAGLRAPAGLEGTDYSAGDGKDSSAFISLPVPITSARTNGFAEYRGVRTSRYTYVRSIAGPWLLYDNLEDPYQKRNLCNQQQARRLQEELETDLQRWLGKLDDRFLPAAEYLKRDGLTHYEETQRPVRRIRSPWGDWESTLQGS